MVTQPNGDAETRRRYWRAMSGADKKSSRVGLYSWTSLFGGMLGMSVASLVGNPTLGPSIVLGFVLLFPGICLIVARRNAIQAQADCDLHGEGKAE